MPRAYIALGGNLGDVRRTLNDAIADLRVRIQARMIARSSDYRTPPWGDLDQPPFVNACMCVDTDLAPQTLLAQMHAVERAFGRDRTRERRWGPRTLDLDLLDYHGLVSAPGQRLRLPHPGIAERIFVLKPLAEIAPGWKHPVTRQSAAMLLRRLDPLGQGGEI